MRIVRFDRGWDVPTVKVVLGGRKGKTVHAMLVFDTGAAMTQVDVDLAETLGYSARDGHAVRSVAGATGDTAQGYIFNMSKP